MWTEDRLFGFCSPKSHKIDKTIRKSADMIYDTTVEMMSRDLFSRTDKRNIFRKKSIKAE